MDGPLRPERSGSAILLVFFHCILSGDLDEIEGFESIFSFLLRYFFEDWSPLRSRRPFILLSFIVGCLLQDIVDGQHIFTMAASYLPVFLWVPYGIGFLIGSSNSIVKLLLVLGWRADFVTLIFFCQNCNVAFSAFFAKTHKVVAVWVVCCWYSTLFLRDIDADLGIEGWSARLFDLKIIFAMGWICGWAGFLIDLDFRQWGDTYLLQ